MKKSRAIFISHSSQDKEIAEALVGLLRSALNLSPREILCTSVEGHRLTVGAEISNELREELLSAKSFVAIISPHSILSAYVLFELGGRWGAKKPIAPLLAPGARTEILKGPLADLNTLSCDSTEQLQQFIEDIAAELDLEANPPNSYLHALQAVQESRSISSEGPADSTREQRSPMAMSDDARILLIEAAQDSGGEIMRLHAGGGVRIRTNGKDFSERGNPRSAAQWDAAIQALSALDLIQQRNKEVYFVTHKGYTVAERLKHE